MRARSAAIESHFGWRGACTVWAGLHLLIGLPLNACLPRLPYEAAVDAAASAKPETAPLLAVAGALRADLLIAYVFPVVHQRQGRSSEHLVGSLTLLREGLEALLIVVGMVAFLRKAERADVLPYVHGGWIVALTAGGLTWAVATYFINISGASREVTEGASSVFAAVVLLSVGLWVHQKSTSGRWQAYLKEKLSAAMSKRSAWALFALSFIAVYREVLRDGVLFYSALSGEGNNGALRSRGSRKPQHA